MNKYEGLFVKTRQADEVETSGRKHMKDNSIINYSIPTQENFEVGCEVYELFNRIERGRRPLGLGETSV